VRYDAAPRKGWIQDQEIDLNDANVVLVDEVDAPTGPRVVGVLRIDPSYRALMEPPPAGVPVGPRGMRERPQPVPVHTFIRRSPELVEYLKCDVHLPDLQPYEQQVFDRWCAAVKQP